jgi:hypothetical protein
MRPQLPLETVATVLHPALLAQALHAQEAALVQPSTVEPVAPEVLAGEEMQAPLAAQIMALPVAPTQALEEAQDHSSPVETQMEVLAVLVSSSCPSQRPTPRLSLAA